jgi:hypothetical protein
MSDFENDDITPQQLKLRLQNLKVLLEEAILSGSHYRMKQLLSDIKQMEDVMALRREREDDIN